MCSVECAVFACTLHNCLLQRQEAPAEEPGELTGAGPLGAAVCGLLLSESLSLSVSFCASLYEISV